MGRGLPLSPTTAVGIKFLTKSRINPTSYLSSTLHLKNGVHLARCSGRIAMTSSEIFAWSGQNASIDRTRASLDSAGLPSTGSKPTVGDAMWLPTAMVGMWSRKHCQQ